LFILRLFSVGLLTIPVKNSYFFLAGALAGAFAAVFAGVLAGAFACAFAGATGFFALAIFFSLRGFFR
jgi:hypothetical protein